MAYRAMAIAGCKRKCKNSKCNKQRRYVRASERRDERQHTVIRYIYVLLLNLSFKPV
jgi:hypothetical protein